MKIFGFVALIAITCILGVIGLVLYSVVQEQTFDGSSGITAFMAVPAAAALLFVQCAISMLVLWANWKKDRVFGVVAQIPLVLSVAIAVSVFI